MLIHLHHVKGRSACEQEPSRALRNPRRFSESTTFIIEIKSARVANKHFAWCSLFARLRSACPYVNASGGDGAELTRLCGSSGQPPPPLVVEACLRMGRTRLVPSVVTQNTCSYVNTWE